MQIQKILVPIDFSPSAGKALDVAAEFAEKHDAEVVLLHAYHVSVPMTTHVAAGGPVLPTGFYEQIRENAQHKVDELAEQVAKWGVKASGRAVGEPASIAIVDAAEKLPADLIVMGTRGNTGLKHVLLGSVAERVIRHAPCPVVTVKADD